MHVLTLVAGLVLSAVMTLTAAAHAATFVYVSNAEDGNIGVYTLASDGSLQPGARFEWRYTVPAHAMVPQLYHDALFHLA